jgi:hypothetical protein
MTNVGDSAFGGGGGAVALRAGDLMEAVDKGRVAVGRTGESDDCEMISDNT